MTMIREEEIVRGNFGFGNRLILITVCSTMLRSKFSKVVMLLALIWEVSGLNLGRNTDYPEIFVVFLMLFRRIRGQHLKWRSKQLQSKLCAIYYYLPFVPPFGDLLSDIERQDHQMSHGKIH